MTLRLMLEAVAILLAVVGVVVWCLPPRPEVRSRLADDWTPGGVELQVAWRELGSIAEQHWLPSIQPITDRGFVIGSYNTAHQHAVYLAGFDGTVRQLTAPDVQLMRNRAGGKPDAIWAVEQLKGRAALLDFDPATAELRQRIVAPPEDQPPIAEEFFTYGWLTFPDGAIGLIVIFPDQDRKAILLRLDPGASAISFVPLPDKVNAHSFRVHPSGLLIASSWRLKEALAFDPISGEERPAPASFAELDPSESWGTQLRIQTAPPAMLRDEFQNRKSILGTADDPFADRDPPRDGGDGSQGRWR